MKELDSLITMIYNVNRFGLRKNKKNDVQKFKNFKKWPFFSFFDFFRKLRGSPLPFFDIIDNVPSSIEYKKEKSKKRGGIFRKNAFYIGHFGTLKKF